MANAPGNPNLSGTRKWLVLIALALSVLVVGIDLTVLNVALPVIGPDLHASTTDLQWFADSYSLVLAAALLPVGVLGDRIGRKTMLIVGLLLFCVTSAACAYAPDAGTLIAVRAVLGLGAAPIIPLALAMLPVLFTPQERPRAIAVMMTATMLGYPLGPVLGGWLLTHFWWGSVFLINVPVALLAVLAVVLLMPQSANPHPGRFDALGSVLTSVGLVGVTYGVVEAGADGWSSASCWAPLAVGAVVLIGFVRYEKRVAAAGRTEPLVDFALFRSRHFTWGTVLATFVSFAMFGIMFTIPLYFQDVSGSDSLLTGTKMLPMIGGLVIGGALAARLQEPRAPRGGVGEPRALAGFRSVVAVGFAIIAIGLGLGAHTTVNARALGMAATGEGYAATWFALLGFGLGFALPASTNSALSALTKERSGVGSAVIMTLRQVGATIGVALLGTILGSVYRDRLGATSAAASLPDAARTEAGQSVSAGVTVAQRSGDLGLLQAVRDSFVHAMDDTLLVCTAIAVLGAVLAVWFLPGRGGASSTPIPSSRAHAEDPEEESIATS
jgi:MFS transporter, DHA2 family, multidrug resistance protein